MELNIIKSEQKDLEAEKFLSFKNKNPNFKNQRTLTNNYSFFSHSSYSSINIDYESLYDIYKLNSNKNEFYIAFQSLDGEGLLKIIKYNLFNQKSEEILTLENESNSIKKLKYFYDPVYAHEYLFICSKQILKIILIKNEKEYEIIDKIEKIGKTGGFSVRKASLPINNFEIFHNKFNKKNYLIVSFFYQSGCTTKKNDINFYEFDKGKLILINTFSFLTLQETKLNILYEDNVNKKLYLLIHIKNRLKYFEINDDLYKCNDSEQLPNLYDSGEGLKKLNEVFPRIFYEFGCIIYNNINTDDYLYLCDKNSNLTVINLTKKEIIKELNLNINFKINTVISFKNKYIIFGTSKSFLILEVNSCKIISQYILNNGLISIKKYNFDENISNYLFIDFIDNTIKLFY